MRRFRYIRNIAVHLACMAILFPPNNLCAGTLNQQIKPQTVPAPAIVDVALSAGGTVTGHVVDDRGSGVINAVVSIRQGDREIAKTLADTNGLYVVNNLRGGVHRVIAAGGTRVFRFWAPKTAPPSARDTAISVAGNEEVVRSQGRMGTTLLTAGVLAAVAAAIAIPVSLNNDDGTPASP